MLLTILISTIFLSWRCQCQECLQPNQRCLCSSQTPYCPCESISTDGNSLNFSSTYNSHLILVPGQGCKPCSPSCQKCSFQSICNICFDQFNLVGSSCEPCPINCRSCTGSICIQCRVGYYLDFQKNCQPCPLVGTRTCTITALKSCLSNYWLDNNGAVCVNCDPMCKECSSTIRCNVCLDGYYAQSGKCFQCKSDCATCPDANSCILCKQNNTYFNLITGSCLTCSTPNCLQCNSSSACSLCKSGYALSQSNQCIGLNTLTNISIPNFCSQFSYNSTIPNLNCTQCQFNYYKFLGQTQCKYSCSHACSSCRGPHFGLCLSCNDNFRLVNLHCIPNYNIGNGAVFQRMYTAPNNPGIFLSATLLNPSACIQETIAGGVRRIQSNLNNLGSYKVFIKWKAYIYEIQDIVGSSDVRGYQFLWNNNVYLQNASNCASNCKQCIHQGEQEILNGIKQNNTIYFKSLGSDLIGISELIIIGYRCGGVTGSSCAECSSINICTKCYNQNYFISGERCLIQCPDTKYTHLLSKTCYDLCPAGTYPQQALQVCQDCTSPCFTCRSVSICLTCIPGYFLFADNSQCLQSCPVRYFPNVFRQVCQRCLFPCLQCTSNTFCKSCLFGFFDNQTFTCVTQCPTQTYGNLNTVACQACTIPCKACQYLPSSCLSCIIDYYYYEFQCLKSCPQGYYSDRSDPTFWKCSHCDQTCSICVNTPTNCSKCSIGYLYLNQCVSLCPGGFYQNSLKLTCENCAPQCGTCSLSADRCLSCINSSYSYIANNFSCIAQCPVRNYPSSGKCVQCQLPCYECTSQKNCLSCYDQFLLGQSCVANCPLGTFSNINSLKCQSCNLTLCKQCKDSSQTCTVCQDNLKLLESKCLSVCPNGYYFLNDSTLCIRCALPCENCQSETKCLSCVRPYIFFNNSCASSCATSYFPSTTMPINGNQTTICLPCDSGCISCKVNSTNCQECTIGFALHFQNNSCLTICPEGFYSYDKKCLKCVNPCLTCSSQLVCKACKPENGIFLNSGCVPFCPGSYYNSTSNNSCLKCDSNCLECQGMADNCLVCLGGSYLSAETTTGSSIKKTCKVACSIGFYPENQSRKCLKCSAFCKECSTRNDCTVCSPEHVLVNLRCVDNCPSGFFYRYNKSASLTNSSNWASCQPCPSLCLHCQQSLACTACKTGAILTHDSKCVQICPNGYYELSNQCLQCAFPCLNCTARFQCINCQRGYYNDKQCLISCPSATYLQIATFQKPQSNVCNPCPLQCLSCLNGTYCTACRYGCLYLGKCMVSCPISFYNSFGVCLECPSGCAACTDVNLCTECHEDRHLYDGQCLDSCPFGWVAININTSVSVQSTLSHCLQCNNPCRTCLITTDQCTSCISQNYLYLQSCGSTCPSGSYPQHALRACETCTSPCATCENAYSCDTCIYGYILYRQSVNNQCVKGPYCPNSYYLNIDSKECTFKCQDDLYVEQQHRTCSKSCPPQFVHYPLNRTCLQRCPGTMWVDHTLTCKLQAELPNGAILPYLTCQQYEIRNLMILKCKTTIPMRNLYQLKITNFSIELGQIELIHVTDLSNFYLVITPTQKSQFLLKWTKISLTYLYELQSVSTSIMTLSSSVSESFISSGNNISYPLQNIDGEIFIESFHSYTLEERSTGLNMLQISQSIGIGALIIWIFAVLKDTSVLSLLFVSMIQFLYSITLSKSSFAPNFNQFLQGFKVCGFYSLGLQVSGARESTWETQSVNRPQIYGVVDHTDLRVSLLPSIFVFCFFFLVFIFSLILYKVVPKITQNQHLLNLSQKCEIIYERFSRNYWHHCALVLTSPISISLFSQIASGSFQGLTLSIAFVAILLVFYVRALIKLRYVTRSQRPARQFLCVIGFQTVLLNGLTIWSSLYIFCGTTIVLIVLNLYFWYQLFLIEKWKSLCCQIIDGLRLLLMIMICVGEFNKEDWSSTTMYLYGWGQIALAFLIVVILAVFMTREFFYNNSANKISPEVQGQKLLPNINEEDQVSNSDTQPRKNKQVKTFFSQQTASNSNSDSDEEDIIDFYQPSDPGVNFKKPPIALMRYDKNQSK